MAPLAGVQVTVRAPSTRSVAVAVKVTEAPVGPVASRLKLDGNDSVGPVVSRTMTLKPPLTELPATSDAVQLTAVVPRAKSVPVEGVHVTVRLPLTESVALGAGENVTIAPVLPVASTVCVGGTVIVGAVVSCTFTVNVLLDEFERVSVEVHVTVVVAMAKVEPLAGTQVVGRAPSTTSAAEVENETAAPAAPVASTVRFAGTVMTGPVVSCTLMVKVLLDEFERVSLEVHVTVVVAMAKVVPLNGAHVTVRAPSTASAEVTL